MSVRHTSDPTIAGAIEHLTDRVTRIALPLPMADLKVVNAYAITGEDGLTLVDPGWADDASESALVNALRELGYTPADVRRILVTHAHWDHYTLAVQWQRRYGATVYLGSGERHTLDAFVTTPGMFPNQQPLLRRAGAAELAEQVARLPVAEHERDIEMALPDVWLDGGEEIDCRGTTIVALATPGHTRGHVVFSDPAADLMFSGDHILPRITPSIGFERAPDRLPLRSYLSSLQFCLSRAHDRMLPAHGAVCDHIGPRVSELLDHHEQRLKLIVGLLAAGAETAFEVTRQMRWTRRDLTIDELGTIHGMTAVLEVVAHLELLVTQGVITANDGESVRRYAVA